MAEKRGIKLSIRNLQRIKTWQLLVLLLFAGLIAATFLRLNNIGMVERRSAVIAADDANDKGAIANRLYDLQRYVTSHMNTNMGNGVYLQQQYTQDSKKLLEAASNTENPNGNIYVKAQDVCRPRYTVYTTAYLQCTLSELNKYPASSNLITNIQPPRADNYRYDYISPVWSPDFAGFSVLVCIIIVFMILARLLTLVVLRILLRYHYKSI